MWKSFVSRFKPLPIASLETGSAALTVASITGGEPITTGLLGTLAALALLVKVKSGQWSDEQADEVAKGIDKLVREERSDARELIKLFDLPTDGGGSNESALLLLANGLREEIREHGLDQAAIDAEFAAVRASLARLENTTQETLSEVKDRKALEEAVARLTKMLDREMAAHESTRAELASARSTEEVVRESVEAVAESDSLSPDELTGLTPDELQRRLVKRSDRLEQETADQQQAAAAKAAELIKKAAELIENDRRILHLAELRSDVTEVEKRIARILARRQDDFDAINRRGHLRHLRGDLIGAETDYRRVEQLAGNDQSRLSVAYGNLGLVYRTRGDLALAEEMLKKSLAIVEELGLKQSMASLYGNLGVIYKTRGDLALAEEMHKKSLAINEELGRKEGMASDYGNLGLIYRTRGDLALAEEMLKKSLAISEELGRKEGMASGYGNLGLIYQTRGDLALAEEMHKKALAIEEELGRKEGMAREYGNLGLIYYTRGELHSADEMHRKSLAIYEQLDCNQGIADQAANLGRVCLKRGDLGMAEEMFKKSLAIDLELGDQEGVARHYCNLGGIASMQGDFVLSEEMQKKSLKISKAIGYKEGLANAYCGLGATHHHRDDLDLAEEMYELCLVINKELGCKEGMAVALCNLGSISMRQGLYSKMRALWTESRDLYAKIGISDEVERLQTWIDRLPDAEPE
ncbi:MAG: tetratricopeptide repeat protein [Planctomycetota bacterium]